MIRQEVLDKWVSALELDGVKGSLTSKQVDFRSSTSFKIGSSWDCHTEMHEGPYIYTDKTAFMERGLGLL